MKARIHAIAGVIGFLTILLFWTATVYSELSGSPKMIVIVKNAIMWGLLILVPCMVIVGGSGWSLGKGQINALVLAKKKRMPIIAINGLIVLLPSALFLADKANNGVLDVAFYAVQGLELISGAMNLALMGINIRDGLIMTGRIQIQA